MLRLTKGSILPALVLIVSLPNVARSDEPRPDPARLKAHVAKLASPEFGGRRDAGAMKTRAYLVAQFKALGLPPLFAEGYEQKVPGVDPKIVAGKNVGAKLVGSDPKLRDEWVIVSAHYDHLGERDGRLYPGADDNATGVAMMIEVARSLVESPTKPKRSVMFVGFDLEEAGLWGSRYFAEHMPVPLEKVKLFVTADMIGRALGGVCERQVFVMGSEHIAPIRESLERSSVGLPIEVGTLGADVLLIDRSDYGPFRSRKVPFLFFSTGENPCYHTPEDTPETIDYPKFTAISRLIYGVVREAVVGEAPLPKWSDSPDHPLAEALTIRDVFKLMLEHRQELKISGTQAFIMRNAIRNLDAIASRRVYTPGERAGLIRVAQAILATVF